MAEPDPFRILRTEDLDDDEFEANVAKIDAPKARRDLTALLDSADFDPLDESRMERLFLRLGADGVARDLLRITLDQEKSPLSRASAARVLIECEAVEGVQLLAEPLLIGALLWSSPDPVVLTRIVLAINPAAFERIERLRVSCSASGDVYDEVNDPALRAKIDRRLAAEGDPARTPRLPVPAGEPRPRFRALAHPPGLDRIELAIVLDARGDTVCVEFVTVTMHSIDAAYGAAFVPRDRLGKLLGEFQPWTPIPYEEAAWLVLEAYERGVDECEDSSAVLRWASWGAPGRAPTPPAATVLPTEDFVYDALDRYGLLWTYSIEEGLPMDMNLEDPQVRQEMTRRLEPIAIQRTRWATRMMAIWLGWRGDLPRAGAFMAMHEDINARGAQSYLVEILLRADGRTALPWEMRGSRIDYRYEWKDLVDHLSDRPRTRRTLAEAELAEVTAATLQDTWPHPMWVRDVSRTSSRIAERLGVWYAASFDGVAPVWTPEHEALVIEETASVLLEAGQVRGDATLIARQVAARVSWLLADCAARCPHACWRGLDADASEALAADSEPDRRPKE